MEVAERMPYVSRGGFKLAGGAGSFSDRRVAAAFAWMWDRPPADSPIACCSAARRGCTRSMWATGSSTGNCATIRAWSFAKASTRAIFSRPIFRRTFDLAVCDASFISATLLIPAIVPAPEALLLRKHGEMVILVKPQFEVGQGPGGQRRHCARSRSCTAPPAIACERRWKRFGFAASLLESPILGAEGNREFLLYARPVKFLASCLITK